MRKLLQRWPDLSAAAAAAANPKLQQQVVVCSRKASDSAILQLAARSAAMLAAPAAASAAPVASEDEGPHAGEAGAEETAATGEAPAEAAAPADAAGMPAPEAVAAAEVTAPDRLTLELGWDTYKPRIQLDDEEGEEEEEPVVEFALAMYNLQVRLKRLMHVLACMCQHCALYVPHSAHQWKAVFPTAQNPPGFICRVSGCANGHSRTTASKVWKRTHVTCVAEQCWASLHAG